MELVTGIAVIIAVVSLCVAACFANDANQTQAKLDAELKVTDGNGKRAAAQEKIHQRIINERDAALVGLDRSSAAYKALQERTAATAQLWTTAQDRWIREGAQLKAEIKAMHEVIRQCADKAKSRDRTITRMVEHEQILAGQHNTLVSQNDELRRNMATCQHAEAKFQEVSQRIAIAIDGLTSGFNLAEDEDEDE